ncbi:response regulator transcription factor [Nocardia sp. NPDC051030]|uniref:response regulator transcription factor n=1 Tax=Nocardia sp. NPDC051030 TaxID=3155162 RepID=UPI0034395714
MRSEAHGVLPVHLGHRAIRLMVVTHHQLFRDSLRALLGTDRLRVVGEAASVEDACAAIERLQPDAALFDIELPTPPNRQTLATLRATAPRTRLIALGSNRDDALEQRLTAYGISSYVSKESGGGELMHVLRETFGGHDHFALTDIKAMDSQAGALSERERAVLELVAQSMTNAQIARRLQISEATVKRHVHNIFRKLRAVSRMDAVHKSGLLSAPTARRVSDAPRSSRPAGHGALPAGRF